MMTKQDYVKFAEMIAERKSINIRASKNESDNSMLTYAYGYDLALTQITDDMIKLFSDDNPNFDAERFNQYIDKRVKQLTSHH